MAEKIGIRPATIIVDKKRLLLVKSEYKGNIFYLLPGGGVEFGETIEEAAIRETLEETGKRIKIIKPVYINEYIDNKDRSKRVINIFFLSEILKEDMSMLSNDGGKIKSIEWVDLDNLKDINDELTKFNASLYIKKGNPADIWSAIFEEFNVYFRE